MLICYFYDDGEHVNEYSDQEGKETLLLTQLQTCPSIGSLTKWLSEYPKNKGWEVKD